MTVWARIVPNGASGLGAATVMERLCVLTTRRERPLAPKTVHQKQQCSEVCLQCGLPSAPANLGGNFKNSSGASARRVKRACLTEPLK